MATLYRRTDIAKSDEAIEEPVSILFLQDDPSVAEMYRVKLELDGYRVTIAAPGEKVEELLLRHHADIIYLDIRTTNQRNLALLKQLRSAEETRGVPVVILSGAPAEELKARGVQLGIMDYLVRCDTALASLEAVYGAADRV